MSDLTKQHKSPLLYVIAPYLLREILAREKVTERLKYLSEVTPGIVAVYLLTKSGALRAKEFPQLIHDIFARSPEILGKHVGIGLQPLVCYGDLRLAILSNSSCLRFADVKIRATDEVGGASCFITLSFRYSTSGPPKMHSVFVAIPHDSSEPWFLESIVDIRATNPPTCTAETLQFSNYLGLEVREAKTPFEKLQSPCPYSARVGEPNTIFSAPLAKAHLALTSTRVAAYDETQYHFQGATHYNVSPSLYRDILDVKHLVCTAQGRGEFASLGLHTAQTSCLHVPVMLLNLSEPWGRTIDDVLSEALSRADDLYWTDRKGIDFADLFQRGEITLPRVARQTIDAGLTVFSNRTRGINSASSDRPSFDEHYCDAVFYEMDGPERDLCDLAVAVASETLHAKAIL